MAINKNFVIKNGVQVATDLIVGDSDTKKVGIGTTIAGYTLHVGATNVGGRGGIGATDLNITGVGTVTNFNVTGLSTFANDISVSGMVSAQALSIGTTEVIDRGLRLSGIASLDAVTTATIEEAIRVGPNSFSDLKVSGISTFVGVATFATGLDVVSGVSTFGAPLRIGFAGTTDHAGVALGATVGFGTSAFFQDGAAIYMGDDSDLKIFHDSSNSFIQDLGTGNLYVDSNSLQIRNATGTETQAVFTENGSVELYFDDSKKVETTSGGLKVTGITTLTNRLHVQAGVSTFDADVRFGIGATVGFGTSAFFRDNAAIFMGNDEDLKIFTDQDGDVRLQQQNAGKIIISSTGAGDVIKLQARHGEESIIARVDGAVEQYYDDSKKTETTSGGFNITGITTFSDRINVVSGVSTFQDNAKLTFGAQSDLIVYHSGSHSFIQDTTGTGNLYIDSNSLQIRNAAGDETQATFAENGAVSLFYDDGNVFQTTPQGINVSGVTTSNRLNISGVSTFTSIGSNLIPDTDGSRNIGAAGSEWQDLHIDGTANIDTLVADTAKVSDLTNNRVVIVGTSGELEDDGNFTFDGSTLAITGSIDLSADIDVDGTANLDVLDVDGASNFGADVVFAGASANITFDQDTDDLIFDDNAKAIFGSSSDGLEIFHDGSNSKIKDSGSGTLDILTSGLNIKNAADNENIAKFAPDGSVTLLHNNEVRLTTTGAGVTVGLSSIQHNGNAAFAGIVTANGGIRVGTAITIHPHGGVSIAGIVTIGSDLNVQGDIVYDEITGRNLNITGISTQAGQVNFGTSGVGATIAVNGNATFAGIVTAAQFQGGGVGVGIGSTTDNPFSGEKVGYGFTFIKFAGPGVSTVYADTRAGYTGFATVFIEGGGSSVGAAGTWQNDQVGISTAKSVGVNTNTINDPDLQGRPHVGAAGSFQGLYIGNGMIVNDNQLNGDHYIGTAFGGMMAGPVTINGVLTVDGSYVVV